MNIEKIKAILDLLDRSDIAELKIQDEDGLIEVKKGVVSEYRQPMRQSDAVSAAETETSPLLLLSENFQMKSPIVGTFYMRSSPSSQPFVYIGQPVNVNDSLCVIEAMKVMNEIKSPVKGIIRQICAEEQQIVEYDQVLFEIEEEHV